MFPSFIGILDIQSWWEVPSIAYFCSLFRTAFNLLDFDIEELEEALLTDGTEESASSLLTELIVRLLNGCLGNNDVSAFNYQMYLRRLFRRKCQDTGRYNPFNTDIDFQFLPLRTKVEILYALCDFRLDADDVFDLFKNLEAESLRVEPLGWDDHNSAYWYFYGTRLYREDVIRKTKGKAKKKKCKEGSKKRGWIHGDEWDDEEVDRVWQVVCFTEEDWSHLTEKFSKATSKVEKELYRSLSQNFLPEIPRLFQEKERLQRKRLLEHAPRRTSSRVLQKIKQKVEDGKPSESDSAKDNEESRDKPAAAREDRAKRRDLLRTKSVSSESSENLSDKEEMPQKVVKKPKGQDKRSKNSSATNKGEPPPEQPVKTGRKTNNSLASATGQILIPDSVEPANSTRKKLKTSQIFSQTEEDVQTDMYKVLEQLTAHEDAWPFMDPVEEQYAPNYYAVIRRPMDLKKMEERLDTGYYSDFSMFKADFKLIVNNCRLYNGQDNEYTMMVDNLQAAFDRLTEKYIHRLSSSDEEIAVEYQIPTPSRKHKLKTSESPTNHKRRKRKSNSDAGTAPSDKSTTERVEDNEEPEESTSKDKKESHHKSKEDKNKKKRKGHHRHGKHSKNHKKGHKTQHSSKSSKHSKKQKHIKDKEGKKGKNKKKRSKQADGAAPPSPAAASPESSHRSRSASPLPSIHTPTPSPSPPPSQPPSPPPSLPSSQPPSPLHDPDFFKDKYDKIKERRRNAARDAWETLLDYKQKHIDKQKQNINVPEKDKNQKLRETIEKLKAKNEKYKDSAIFKNLFSATKEKASKSKDKDRNFKEDDETDFSDEDTMDSQKASKAKNKAANKKKPKKIATAKNESASEALEQAVKDISKWLDEAPKGSYASSSCDSPAQPASPAADDDTAADRTHLSRKDLPRKRPSSRETKNIKRRDLLGKRNISIDRLQPGKSKGNLLTNSSKCVEKVEELSPGPLSKVREGTKSDESSPKLSLGSVLPTVEFTLGKDHNFDNDDDVKEDSKPADEIPPEPETAEEEKKEAVVDEKPVESSVECKKEEAVIEPEPPAPVKPSQEKATPNLSAWFKAFGTPKSTTTAPATSVKKKPEDAEHDEKQTDTAGADLKPISPKMTKYDSPNDPETPNPDGGDSPLGNPAPRRRTSTGSSVSERSSFSQDLDSPRHQMSHTSPLLRSPASPRTDDFQKISYPIINGTVRAGFYQDTTSMKSSPEKSCSPREGPQSPYSPYSQHVYASNNMMGSTTPNYFLDHSKSPLPTYGQNQPPPYYDSHKSTSQARPSRGNEEYAPAAADPYQHSQFGRSFSPAPTSYTQNQPVTYSQPTKSPLTSVTEPAEPPKIAPVVADSKTTLFPVKKRTYSEIESTAHSAKNQGDPKENITSGPSTSDYQKIVQSMHSITAIPSASVDDIAAALSEKTRHIRDRISDYTERHTSDVREPPIYENPGNLKKEALSMNKPTCITSNDSIDMVNMGYMNPDDRRHSGDGASELDYSQNRDTTKNVMNPQPKGYEIDAIALNLGMNSQNMQKPAPKTSLGSTIIPPAHCHERAHSDVGVNQMAPHSHHPEYSNTGPSSSIGNFSLTDIELANKKLYAGGAASAAAAAAAASGSALDYGNWKMASQMRKPDMDYAAAYATGAAADKLKDLAASTPSAINYNKNVQSQSYHNYNVPRTSRAQDLPSELRIPNPRNLMKGDHNMSSAACLGNNDMMTKTNETSGKAQKPDKHAQNHPLVSSLPYKVPYSSHSSLPLDSLRNLQNIPQMLERYTNDERYLSSFAASSASLYHDKTFQMAQMFNKSLSSDVHPTSTSASIYSQPSATMSKESSIYKTSTPALAVESKSNKNKRKRSETKTQAANNQSYHGQSSASSDVLKSSMVPGSAFNFGATPNISLGTGGLYPDSGGFSIEDFRNSTANQLMAANYMAAAVAHQRNNAEANAEKMAKPAHQNSGHGSGSFPFMGHGQARGSYGFVGAEPSSPLYQQYLQRHQEELLRQTGAQIMGLYPPPYPALSARQPYDTINRPSWL